MEFGQKLLFLREKQNQSQTQIAKGIGTTQRKISYWETGKTEPNLEDIRKICKYFHISADYLLGLTEDAHPLPKENQ